MSNENEPPPWQRTPWWHGRATRDHILVGFVIVCLVVALIIFAIVVWGL